MRWGVIPDIGRTSDGVTLFPVTAAKQQVGKGPLLEYEIQSADTGNITLHTYLSPTLNFHNDEGLQFAIAIDDEQPQVITINKEDNNVRTWESWVAANIIIKKLEHKISNPGKHLLKVWAVDPGVVVQKFVLDLGGYKQSYLGPNETRTK